MHRIIVTYGNASKSYPSGTSTYILPVKQGVTVKLTIKLQLVDGHLTVPWENEYAVMKGRYVILHLDAVTKLLLG